MNNSWLAGIFESPSTQITDREVKIKTSDKENIQDHLYAQNIISTKEPYGVRVRDRKSLLNLKKVLNGYTHREDKMKQLDALIDTSSCYGKLHPSLQSYIDDMRGIGYTWQQVADALHVSRQALLYHRKRR